MYDESNAVGAVIVTDGLGLSEAPVIVTARMRCPICGAHVVGGRIGRGRPETSICAAGHEYDSEDGVIDSAV